MVPRARFEKEVIAPTDGAESTHLFEAAYTLDPVTPLACERFLRHLLRFRQP